MVRKKTSRKPKTTPKTSSKGSGLHDILSSDKTDFVLGLLLFLGTIVITIAMVSFLQTGAADQSILEDMRPGEWLNTDRIFANRCGSWGAMLAYLLITKSFGLPSFLIPAFFFLASLRMMGVYKINLWKCFLFMALIMIWCSVALAKFLAPVMSAEVYNPGGDHGLFVVQHIENVIGMPGLTAVLAFFALAFLTYLSASTMKVVRRILNPAGFGQPKLIVAEAKPEDNEEEPATEQQARSEGVETPPSQVVDLTEFVSEKPAEAPAKTADKAPVAEGSAEPIVEAAKAEEKADGKRVTSNYDMNTPINPREPFLNYKFPTLDLLKHYDNDGKPQIDMDEIKSNNARIVEVLNSFGVQIREIKATVGPAITLYEITPAEGVRISKIRNLEDDIALSLAALGIRIIAPIPGKGTIGIEVPNKNKQIVSMESILNSKKFQTTTMDLPLALGKTITNEVYMVDLAKIPHLLVAGATGQGKSVGLNAIITSLLYKKHPNELKIILVDPKKVEFSVYSKIADHFMACVEENEEEPIITDVKKVVKTLNSLCVLMDSRYDLLKQAGVRNIKEYNAKFVKHELNPEQGHEYMPYIVVIIDEYGDLILTAGKEIELPITRIAQLARAVGIHMIIATQRPTTNIITGSIKANFPGRIAFRVGSMIDSRTILDRPGANQLVGRGDMLYLNGGEPVRVQCAFVDTPEIERINDYVSKQPGPVEPLILPEPPSEDGSGSGSGGGDIGNIDSLFGECARAVVMTQQGSTSMIQRRFSIGYNRAGRIMDQLEQAGIVGEAIGSKPREVLVKDEATLQSILNTLKQG